MVYQYQAIIDDMIKVAPSTLPNSSFDLETSAAQASIKALTPQQMTELIVESISWIREHEQLAKTKDYHDPLHQSIRIMVTAIPQLLRQKLPLTHDQVFQLWDRKGFYWNAWNVRTYLKVIENYLQDTDQSCSPQITELLWSIYVWQWNHAEGRRNKAKIKSLLREYGQWILNHGEVWAETALADLQSLPSAQQQLWSELFALCMDQAGGSPTSKWLKSAQPYVKKLGSDVIANCLKRWFSLVDQGRTTVLDEPTSDWLPDPNLLLDDCNADALKGLVWLTPAIEDPDLPGAVARLAISAYRKVPKVGPRCVRLGNACVWALGSMSSGIPQLVWLQAKVKFGSAQKNIDKMFNQVAERLGLPRHEIEEMAIPSYGMEDVGVRREILGEHTAELVVTGTSSTELRWIKPDGKPQKSVPAAIKADFADDLKELKTAAKEIQKMIPAQRQRIENLYLESRIWDFDTWRERYLDHPLVGTLARRLIWQFTQDDRICEGIWHQGQLVNLAGDPLLHLVKGSTKVQLWHPIHASTETIFSWRQWLFEHQVQQPFKQAHREIYLLTPAEEATNVYSNRFATHILKQHVFNGLCSQRGWKNKLRLMVDDDLPPAMRYLPPYGIRAEFWIQSLETDTTDLAVNITESGAYLYVTTDQVRFYPENAALNSAHACGESTYRANRTYATQVAEPIPLEQIPALVFSEIMRDVDLFVGVASVGNDPTWVDGGYQRQHYSYWYQYSFGHLNETAKTRKDVLEKLIPRLKIGKQCRFKGKFLMVEGSFRTYKIHLGSGNILMDPDGQYLCIVPSQVKSGDQNKIFLPFEGDPMLAVILSKALLLAEDAKINDRTILSQIKAH